MPAATSSTCVFRAGGKTHGPKVPPPQITATPVLSSGKGTTTTRDFHKENRVKLALVTKKKKNLEAPDAATSDGVETQRQQDIVTTPSVLTLIAAGRSTVFLSSDTSFGFSNPRKLG